MNQLTARMWVRQKVQICPLNGVDLTTFVLQITQQKVA